MCVKLNGDDQGLESPTNIKFITFLICGYQPLAVSEFAQKAALCLEYTKSVSNVLFSNLGSHHYIYFVCVFPFSKQRGVGEKAVGTSVSLVAPAEEREHQKICELVQGTGGSRSLDQVSIDGRLLNEAQERVALATKIVSCNDVETQAVRKNKWLQDAAKDAGLDVDEDMIEGGLLGGDKRDRQRFIDANRARTELRQLLAKPMRIQHFGKFLSGVGLRESIKSEGEVKPFVVRQLATKTKHRQRKGSKKKTM